MLGLHLVSAIVLGAAGFLSATDPTWGDLQRTVVAFLAGLWIAGALVTGLIARYLLSSPAVRIVLLMIGPLLGIAALFVGARF